MGAVSIIGFDSAWTDNPKAPGALRIIRLDAAGHCVLVPPMLITFAQALVAIGAETVVSPLRIVATDQPAIVPNAIGMRLVDRIAASLISRLSGGVQPANHPKIGMFDDAAQVWRLKERLSACRTPKGHEPQQTGYS